MLKRAATPRSEIRRLLYSLDAVVDHDGNHARGDRDHRHADQEGPDPSKANGANHERDLAGMVAASSTSRLS
jgi:hypothetical protein